MENKYHPIQEKLNSLVWDKKERIKDVLYHFLGADRNVYVYEAMKVLLLGAISRVFRPGTKFEYMLILVGGQGAGKSTFFRFLAMNDSWFTDDLKKLDDENVFRKMQGHLIIELSEMIATASATEPMEEEPTDETTSPEELDDLDSDDRLLGAEAYASTQKSIMLFDFADNGDYTTRLNYQVSCTYKPNGSGTTRTAYVKNMGWHFARYGGVAHADEPLYCIEPWRNYAASTSGNSVDRDVTLNGSGSTTGSNVWYALPSARREAIGLILLYSDQQWDHSISVTSVKKDSNPNVPLRVATQILIYEIVCGLRDPSSFNRNSSNECGTSGDVFYAAASDSVSGFSSCYNSLVSAIQSAKKIPSFCGSSSSNAPTIQLSGDTGSAYDSNGVLSAFSFSNGNGARFSKSGNTLNITKTGDISKSTVFTATHHLPSASNSSYNIWYMSGSS